jgi:hypothetical protein
MNPTSEPAVGAATGFSRSDVMASGTIRQHDEGLAALRERQKQSRSEWRQLCETLESAQGDELIRNSLDKYQLIRTYRIYGNGFDRLASSLRRAATQGHYDFFRERGMPQNVLTTSFVEVLLEDWKRAIAAKKRRVAEIFRFKYGEDIAHWMVTPDDSARLGTAQPLHDADALLCLTGRSRPGVDFQELQHLRSEVEQLHEQVTALRTMVEAQAEQLRGLADHYQRVVTNR